MPHLTTLSDPSLSLPEQVTNCPCLSTSTTHMSRIGPRLAKDSSTWRRALEYALAGASNIDLYFLHALLGYSLHDL